MDRILKILAVIMVCLMLGSPSCQDEAESEKIQQEQLNEARQSVARELGLDYLDEESKYAFEISAVQKLSDLGDLIPIAADSTLDSSFRIKAGQMILSAFRSENAVLCLFDQAPLILSQVSAGELVEWALTGTTSIPAFLWKEIQVIEPLNRTDRAFYSGKLGFKQVVPSTGEVVALSTLEFSVMKADKIIGVDTLRIWQVQFGDMK